MIGGCGKPGRIMVAVCASLMNNNFKNIAGMKRFLFSLLSIVLSLQSFAFDFELDGISYNIISSQDKTVEVTTSENVYSGNININSTVTNDGVSYSVIKIGDYAFAGCSSLSSVVLPEGLQSIGTGGFSGCTSLASISIPSTVKELGTRSFSACSQIKNISLSLGLEIMGDYCFSGCSSLEAITIPSSVLILGNYCFSGCTKITSMSLPSGVTQIGEFCFNECIALESLELPSGLNSLPSSFISGCKKLISLTIPETVTILGSKCFSGCFIEKLRIPQSVTNVSGDFLDKNPNIKSIEFDANIKYIPTVYQNQERITAGCFVECQALESVIITSPITKLPDYCFKECIALKNVSIPNSVVTLGNCCFTNCQSLTDFSIPESVKTIGGACFFKCKSIKNLSIPAGVTDLPTSEVYYYEYNYMGYGYKQSCLGSGGCFYGCESLESVSIPNTVVNMGYSSFSGCRSLTSVTLPYGVTVLGRSFFADCKSLTSFTISSTVTTLGDRCFSRCESLKNLSIPSSVTSIGEHCFEGCKSLEAIQIPSTISELKTGTFSACSSIKEISIPSSISTIGDGCFSDCSALETFVIPSSVTKIGGACFALCTSLRSIEIPQTITELKYGDYSYWWDLDGQKEMSIWSTSGGFFYKCSSLSEIELPSSITVVGSNCFSGCTNLVKLTSNAENVPETGYSVFGETPYNTLGCLYVPENSAAAYKTAEQWKDWKNIAAIGGGDIVIHQCETPTISYTNGQLSFVSSTENAQYHYTIDDSDIRTASTLSDGIVNLTATYNITVFATAEGYTNSEKVTATLCWLYAEPKTEGMTSDIAASKGNSVLIQSHDGTLSISGADDGTIINVYGVNGQQYGSTISHNGHAIINANLQPNSVAIIKIGGKSVKVVVK